MFVHSSTLIRSGSTLVQHSYVLQWLSNDFADFLGAILLHLFKALGKRKSFRKSWTKLIPKMWLLLCRRLHGELHVYAYTFAKFEGNLILYLGRLSIFSIMNWKCEVHNLLRVINNICCVRFLSKALLW